MYERDTERKRQSGLGVALVPTWSEFECECERAKDAKCECHRVHADRKFIKGRQRRTDGCGVDGGRVRREGRQGKNDVQECAK